MTRLAHLAIPLSLVIAACGSSDSDSDAPTDEDYDDTAQAIGGATQTDGDSGDLVSMSDSVSLALGELPIGFTIDTSGRIHGSRFGIEYSYALTCRDAAGNTLVVCSDLTDSASVQASWSGTLDTPNFDASIEREGSWSISGLQTETAAFEGEGSFSFDSTLQSIFRPDTTVSFTFDADASYDALAIQMDSRQVVDGTASFDVSAHKVVTGTDHDVDRTLNIHADVEFHADQTATLELDGSHRYTINTATGVVVRVN